MLGVRRAGVTTTVNAFEAKGLIRAKRGNITVVNRDGIEKIAGPITASRS